MLQRIKYFQAVVRNNSFSAAAAECNISQSAISQQVRSLENELGFALLVRQNRKFTITPAGEYFYKKSLILVNDYERICAEAMRLSEQEEKRLHIGYLNSYAGTEFYETLSKFTRLNPEVNIKVTGGSHEKLFYLLHSDAADLVFSDQRRVFSEEYVNLPLAAVPYKVLVAAGSHLAGLKFVSTEDLKNTPCILPVQEADVTEQDYFRNVLGIRSEFILADSMEQARLLVISGNGFMLQMGEGADAAGVVQRLALVRGGAPVAQNMCAFWKKDNPNIYAEKFAALLKEEFGEK